MKTMVDELCSPRAVVFQGHRATDNSGDFKSYFGKERNDLIEQNLFYADHLKENENWIKLW